MFLVFDVKNGVKYARYVKSVRVQGKVRQESRNIGRVLDEARGIFCNRERGVFTFDPATGRFGEAPAGFAPPAPVRRGRERLLLDFGDAFLLKELLDRSGVATAATEAMGRGDPDTGKALLFYYILCPMANCHAEAWWEGSYARVLFPGADLSVRGIGDFLAAAGGEDSLRAFFGRYVGLLKAKGKGPDKGPDGILIGGAGLPDGAGCGARILCAVRQGTGLPVYFRHCPGGAVDAAALAGAAGELRRMGAAAKFSVLDEGYDGGGGLDALFENGISFILGLKEGGRLYRELAAGQPPSPASGGRLVSCGGRDVRIRCAECSPDGKNRAYAYIGTDAGGEGGGEGALCRRADGGARDVPESRVRFILLSSGKIAEEEILPACRGRRQIEQVFGIGKGHAGFPPAGAPAGRAGDAFRGHLLLSFLAAAAVNLLRGGREGAPGDPVALFPELRNQKCKVYENAVVPQKTCKKANDCYRLLGVECPAQIAL